MATRGILLLALALAQAGEERGTFRLSVEGRPTGAEDYRLERFDDGKTVLFAKAKFEIEVAGGIRRAYATDTVLTLDKNSAPALYAGYRKAGREEDQVKIQWEKGTAVSGAKKVRTSAAHLVDSTVTAHLIPVLRHAGPGKKKVRLFNPTALDDVDGSVEDRGEVMLRGGGKSVRAREYKVNLGYVTFLAHMDEKKRLLRVWSEATRSLAELEGFEGLSPEPLLPEGVEESEVTFPGRGVTLAGTVQRPRGADPRPAVLLVSDTGPHDRGGTLARGKGGSEEFAVPGPALLGPVARALVDAGFLVLAFDDRGCGASGGDFATAKLEDLEADAAAAVAYLRGRADVASVAIAGHGEGALVACLVGGRDPDLRAVALLGMPGKSLDQLLFDGTPGQQKLFEQIRAGAGDWMEIDERRTFVAWLHGRFLLDPAGALAKVSARKILFHGSRDREALTEGSIPFEGLDRSFSAGGRVSEAFLKALAAELLK